MNTTNKEQVKFESPDPDNVTVSEVVDFDPIVGDTSNPNNPLKKGNVYIVSSSENPQEEKRAFTCCPFCSKPYDADLKFPECDDSIYLVRMGNKGVLLSSTVYDLFLALNNRFGNLVTKEAIFYGMYQLRHEDDTPDWKILDVMICKLRPLLRAIDLEILLVWGKGYILTHGSTLDKGSNAFSKR